MSTPVPLPIEELAHRCNAGQFAFATTAELEDIGVIPGQERATVAIELQPGRIENLTPAQLSELPCPVVAVG